jgi:hypothetical protein
LENERIVKLMKAKQWAKKFNSVNTPEEIETLLQEYAAETGELIMLRTKNSGTIVLDKEKKIDTKPTAIEGAIREQRQKWQSVCRQCNNLSMDYFDHVIMGQYLSDAVTEQNKYKESLNKKNEATPKPEGDGRNLATSLKR